MLYCPVHRVTAYRNHPCNPRTLVSLKLELKSVVDQFTRLDIPVMSASWFSSPVEGSYYEHRITMHIELKHTYPTNILGDLPAGFKWYKETVTDDHIQLSCIGYSEIFLCLEEITVEERVGEIVDEFVKCLSTRDPDALKSIMLLSG